MFKKFKVISVILLLSLMSSNSWAASRCHKVALKTFGCELNGYGYRLSFSKENIRINDGIRRNITPFPMKEFASWQSVQIKKLANRTFIELKVWSLPATEASVQSLHWIWIELVRDKAKILLDRVIQKRRGSVEKPKEQIHDPLLSHHVKELKGGKLKWVAGRHVGTF